MVRSLGFGFMNTTSEMSENGSVLGDMTGAYVNVGCITLS
jgi:hypothetical protein